LGQASEALENAAALEAVAPRNPFVVYVQALCAHLQTHYNRAADLGQQVLSHSRDLPVDARHELMLATASSLSKLSRYGEAEELYKKLAAEHSDTLYQVPWMETLLLRAAKSTKGSQDALSKATRLGQALLKTDRWDYPSVFPMICSVAKASSGMRRHLVVDAERYGNHARFANHSDKPNSILNIQRDMYPPKPVIHAGRLGLKAGEVVTLDYGKAFQPRLKVKLPKRVDPWENVVFTHAVVREDDDMDQELALLHQLNPAMAETNVPGLDVARVTSSKLKGQFELVTNREYKPGEPLVTYSGVLRIVSADDLTESCYMVGIGPI
jgi:tetratricopeptide (TPR) repeat protein